MKKKKLAKNSNTFLVTPERGDSFVIEGKGRNSVSQKLTGVRAYPAIRDRRLKSIVAFKEAP